MPPVDGSRALVSFVRPAPIGPFPPQCASRAARTEPGPARLATYLYGAIRAGYGPVERVNVRTLAEQLTRPTPRPPNSVSRPADRRPGPGPRRAGPGPAQPSPARRGRAGPGGAPSPARAPTDRQPAGPVPSPSPSPAPQSLENPRNLRGGNVLAPFLVDRLCKVPPAPPPTPKGARRAPAAHH